MTIAPIALGDKDARAKMNLLIGEVNGLDGRFADETAARQAAVTGEAAARQAAILALPLPMPVQHRPGDAPFDFGQALPEGETMAAPLAEALLRYDDAGKVVRLAGDNLVAPRHLYAVEPGRRYLATFVVQRRVNSPDPDNDAIRCALAWYGQGKGRLVSTPQTIAQDLTGLTTGSGRQVVRAVVSRAAGADIDIVAPAGARYVRPYVETFGTLVQSDVEVINWLDITDAQAFAPDVSALEDRVGALESLDPGDRLTALESQVTAPNEYRVATIGDLEAATVPVTADTVEVLGYYAAGGGGRARYRFVVSDPGHGFARQSADGRWWEIAEEVPNEKQAGAVGDDVADDKAAVQALIAWAMIDPARRPIELVGRCYCASDLANFHDVIWFGGGSVRVMDGPEFFVAPNRVNRGYSGLGFNTLHLAPTGSDTASGLAPAAPLATMQQAFVVIGRKFTPVQGLWRILLAEGAYAAGATAIPVQSTRSNQIEISGPAVDAWNNTTPPPKPVAISSITSANPPVVTTGAEHGRTNGDKVFIAFAARAGGMHASDGKIYTVANVTGETYELSGVDGTGWDAYTAGGQSFAVVGSRPKAIIYGAGGAVNGLSFDGPVTAYLDNLLFVGCGTKAASADVCGILSTNGAFVRTINNVHYAWCKRGVLGRNQSQNYFEGGGYLLNCDSAYRAIDARYTFSKANPTSHSTTDALVEDCNIGVDVWEGATGHADGIKFLNNNLDIFIRRSTSYCVAIWNRYENTGASKVGIHVADRGTVYREPNTEIWTGTFRPHVLKSTGGGEVIGLFGAQTGQAYTWEVKRISDGSTVTAAGGEATQLLHPMRQGDMSARPQQLACGVILTGTWANGAVTVRLKLGATTLYTLALAANASAREVKADFELYQNNFDTVKGTLTGWDRTSAPALLGDYFQAAFNTLSGGAQDFVITAECAHASDTVSVQKVWMAGMGW